MEHQWERGITLAADPHWIPEYEAFVEGVMDKQEIPGLSVALARGGRVLYARGFGSRDLATGARTTPDTLYELASVGKSMAALAIMILEERGGLAVGDPVSDYLPEFRMGDRGWEKAVTLGHLLSHTSGLPPTGALRYASRASLEDGLIRAMKAAGDWESWIDYPAIDTPGDLMQYLAGDSIVPLGRPGEYFSYSNDGYALLGAIVEKVDGRPFARFLREEVTEPLGMGRTTLEPEPGDRHDISTSYARIGEGDPVPFQRWEHAPAMTAAGFVRSSALEMMRYGEMLLRKGAFRGRHLVRPDRVMRVMASRTPVSPETGYGYGLVRYPDYHGITLIEHGGGGMGVRTHFGIIPELDAAIMVLANGGWAPADAIWIGLVNCLLGLPPEAPRITREEVDVDAQSLQRWVGCYRSGEGDGMTVSLEAGRPMLKAWGGEYCLQPTGPGSAKFRAAGGEREMVFLSGSDGEVAGVFAGHRLVPKVQRSPGSHLSIWRRGGSSDD